MKATVECRVCQHQMPLRSWISEPLPLSLRCTHCRSAYRISESSPSRWLPLLVLFGLSGGAILAEGVLTQAVGWMAGAVGFVAVVYGAVLLQMALARRLYERGELALVEREPVEYRSERLPPLCPACGENLGAARGTCPTCGAEVSAAVDPIICSACGEHIRLPDVCCPVCRARVGSELDL